MPFDFDNSIGGLEPALDYSTGQRIMPDSPAAPTFGQTTGAAFRQSNLIGSVVSSETLYGKATGAYNWRDPNFRVFTPENMAGYEEHEDRFMDVYNADAMRAVKADIDRERWDRETLARSGWTGTGMELVAGIADPTILIPGGAVVKSGRLGYAAGRAALNSALAAGGAAVAQEVGLRASQQLRTNEETAMNIGSSVILGGVLGGASRLFSHAEFMKASTAMDAVRNGAHEGEGAGIEDLARAGFQSVGAAGVAPDMLEDFALSGKATSMLAKLTAWTPVSRASRSASVTHRKTMGQLIESAMYTTRNMAGEGDIAAETEMKEYTRGGLNRARNVTRSAFKEYRKAGGDLIQDEFSREVGKAMRVDDQHAIPEVSRAAQTWRKEVFDPLKERAIAAGMLPADVQPTTAASYFSRMWNRDALVANEAEVKRRFTSYITDAVDAAITAKRLTRDEQLRALDSVAADLSKRTAAVKEARSLSDPALTHREQVLVGSSLGETANHLKGKGERLEKKITNINAPGELDFYNDADKVAYIQEIVDNLFDTVAGRNRSTSAIPAGIVAIDRGPLKERTFQIPDSMVEEFLENDVDKVGSRYARTMSADVALTERFGDASMKEPIDAIRREYAAAKAAKPADAAALEKQFRRDLKDLETTRDILRGTFRAKFENDTWDAITHAATSFNYLRSMGGVAVSALSDIARPAMVHGLGSYIRDGLVPFIKHYRAAKLGVEEAKLAGAVAENTLHARLATLAELTDPASGKAPFRAFMDNMTTGFSRLTGLELVDNFNKSIAANMTQARILRNAEKIRTGGMASLSKGERAYMGYLGLNEERASDVAATFAAHGEVRDGVHIANTEQWAENSIQSRARSAFRAAVNKDVDSIIVTKGIGDVPLFANTATGRLLLQFKSFSLAANQRVLLRGMQEGPTRLVGGIVGMSLMGVMVHMLKQTEANRDISDNWGTLAAEGLDRSGIFSIMFEVNNTLEKVGVPGVYSALGGAGHAINPNAEGPKQSSRYATRSIAAGFMGPSFELANNTIDLAGLGIRNARGAITGDAPGLADSYIRMMRRMSPFASLPGVRSVIDYFVMPELLETPD